MRTLGIAGCSVTMPHKAAVAAGASTSCTDDAAALGAVNCVAPATATGSSGTTPTAPGFVDAAPADEGIDPSGMRCLVVLGAGGAARAVVRALGRAGARRWSW